METRKYSKMSVASLLLAVIAGLLSICLEIFYEPIKSYVGYDNTMVLAYFVTFVLYPCVPLSLILGIYAIVSNSRSKSCYKGIKLAWISIAVSLLLMLLFLSMLLL